VVRADLHGVKEEDIDVSIEGDMLTIKGKKESESEVKEESYYCCERSYGSFYRSIALPATVDSKKIEASYEDGVLEVSLPKAAEVKPKKVAVSAKKNEREGEQIVNYVATPLCFLLKFLQKRPYPSWVKFLLNQTPS
jgi:HSP20 family protein